MERTIANDNASDQQSEQSAGGRAGHSTPMELNRRGFLARAGCAAAATATAGAMGAWPLGGSTSAPLALAESTSPAAARRALPERVEASRLPMETTQQPAFGDVLRHYRTSAGLTQEELAERAGLSVRGLIYLERGARRPYPDTLRRLATALLLTPEERVALQAAVTPDSRALPGPGAAASYLRSLPTRHCQLEQGRG